MASKPVLRVGVDSAVGLITGVISTKTTVGGNPIVCVGAAVASHGVGSHANATMATGSAKTTANGAAVCGAGDTATCGDAGTGGSTSTSYG
jgi:uncharacterized Zn-binding protein involved in type VI secretion